MLLVNFFYECSHFFNYAKRKKLGFVIIDKRTLTASSLIDEGIKMESRFMEYPKNDIKDVSKINFYNLI